MEVITGISPPASQKDGDIVAEARKNADEAWAIDKHNREAAKSDLEFAIGDQWEPDARAMRQGRPCLTFNELGKFRRTITGDARQSRPNIEVSPWDSDSDPLVAEILEDLIREIEHRSKAYTAYNSALDSSSGGGFGYIIVETDYAAENTFELELKIRRVTNPFGIFHDLTCQNFDGSDMGWALECDCVITVDEFHRRYGKDKIATSAEILPSGSESEINWFPNGAVRLGYYYKRIPVKKTIAEVLLADQTTQIIETDKKQDEYVMDAAGNPIGTVKRTRKVDSWKVKKFTISGAEILEEHDWPGTSIPVIPMFGEEIYIQGKRYLHGVIRFAKDPQRFKNYFLTSIAERLMTSHRNPYMGTEAMFEGHEKEWDTAHLENRSHILFNADPSVPGSRPIKDNPQEFSPAEAQMLSVASQGLYDTTGIYPPSLGQKSNEVSGRAILARQKEANSGTFVYIDNRDIAIQRVGEILVEVIPKIYDSSRMLRVRGRDQKVKFVPVNAPVQGMWTPGGSVPVNAISKEMMPDYEIPEGSKFNQSGILVNAQTGQQIFFNDLSIGKYDVKVSVGRTAGTKRQEAVNLLLEFSRAYPPSIPFIGDLMAKNLDFEDSGELAKRFQMLMAMQGQPQAGPAPGLRSGALPPMGGNQAMDEFGNQQAPIQ